MRIKFHPAVKEDLAETARYYEDRQSGLGRDFIEDYREALTLVAKDAAVYRKIYKNLRKLNLRRFKAFAIVYEVRPGHLEIVAVADLRRRPFFWRDRL